MKRRVAMLAVLVTAAFVLTAGPTSAAAGKLDAQVIGNVEIDPGDPTVAYVRARYICERPEGDVGQAGESRRPEQWLTEEGSGARSAAWSHTHRAAVTCDGRCADVQGRQVEWGWGRLRPGQAWVQFCVIPPASEAITWSMRFAAVK